MKVTLDNLEVPVETICFPMGEVSVKVGIIEHANKGSARIFFDFIGGDTLEELALVKDAIAREYEVKEFILVTTYMPYSRQDRVCNRGEALSIKVFATLVDALKFDKIITVDIHNEASLAAFDTPIVNLSLLSVIKTLSPFYFRGKTVVLPDAGAAKKYKIPLVDVSAILVGNKTRNLATGEITDYTIETVYGTPTDDVVVIDDICDGGRTFIELAKLVEGNRTLITPHGGYTKGDAVLKTHYHKIFYLNSEIKWKQL